MNRNLIVEGDDSKITPVQGWNHGPEPIAVVLLALDADRICDDRDTPLALEVWALAENFFLEVFGEAERVHIENLVRPDRVRCRYLTPQLNCERVK